jgi:nitrite reductase (NO-forming)
VAASADVWLALRLAHLHLNVLGWVGLAVVGTEFTLWPTVLRTRMVPGVERAVRWSLPPLAAGLTVAAAGLATQRRALALAGWPPTRPGWRSRWSRSCARRCGGRHGPGAAWMLAAGMAWLVVAVVADLAGLAASRRVVELDGRLRLSGLVPAVAAGFALQTLTGALTYLLPVVFGGGAFGNRRLTAVLELGWPARVAAINLGVLALTAGPAAATVGWWLAGLGLGSFLPLAAVALTSPAARR